MRRSRASSSRSVPDYQNRPRNLRFPTDEENAQVTNFLNRDFLEPIIVDWTALETLGVAEDLQAWLPNPWRRLVEINDTQFMEPTIEFYMTFNYNSGVRDITVPSISFRLNGTQRHISMMQFARALDIFNPSELGLVGQFTEVTEAEILQWWMTISEVVLEIGVTKGSAFDDPRHHLLHRILTTSIYNRRESMNTINRRDLLIMHSLVHRRPRCPATSLALAFPKLKGSKSNSPIAGGNFITRLGRGLQMWTPMHETNFTEVAPHRSLSLDTLKAMMLVKKRRNRYHLVTGLRREIWVRPDANIQEEDEEPEQEEHFDIPPQQQQGAPLGADAPHFGPPPGAQVPPHYAPPRPHYGPPPGWQFPDEASYNPYVAYNNTMMGFENIGHNMQYLTGQMNNMYIDVHRAIRTSNQNYRSLDRRVTNLTGTVHNFQEDFYAYIGQDPREPMEEDDEDDEDDEEEQEDDSP